MKYVGVVLLILMVLISNCAFASTEVLIGGWWNASVDELLLAREQIDAQIVALGGSLPTPVVTYIYITPSPMDMPFPTVTPTPTPLMENDNDENELMNVTDNGYEMFTVVLSAGLRTEPKIANGAVRTIKTGELVTVLESCEADQQLWYKIRCVDGDEGYVLQRTVVSVSTTNTSPTASPTPKVVASTPVPIALRIESVTIKQNSIGIPELYARFTNTGSSSIDRFDFLVECYDRYGEVIKSYGIYDYSSCYFEGSILSPNATTSKNDYWTLYGCNGTVSVKIAITKYHTTNGMTVEIPEDQYQWKKF